MPQSMTVIGSVIALGRWAEGRGRSPLAHCLVDRPAPLDDRRPVRGAARSPRPACAPEEPKLFEGRAHLVVAQEEDVFLVDQETVRSEQRPELARLVPEDREVPVVDVEVVVLDVGKDFPRERKALVEGLNRLVSEERAVLER